MAEKIVSAGVFTQENDLSFLPQGVGEIGAAVIGPTKKGKAFWPTVLQSYDDFEAEFGGDWEDSYVPYTVRNYLRNAGTVTVIRILGTTGYESKVIELSVSSSLASGYVSVGVLHHTHNSIGTEFIGAYASKSGADGAPASASLFQLTITGSEGSLSASLDPTSQNFVKDLLGVGPRKGTNDGNGNYSAAGPADRAYTYGIFENYLSASLAATPNALVSASAITLDLSGSTEGTYRQAITPWVKSQKVGGTASNLFRVHTLGHGTSMNKQYKVGISNVKFASELANSDYGSFTLVLREYNDTDKVGRVVETYSNLNLNPDSANYIGRRIGDKYYELDSNGKLKVNGDWTNISKYVRVELDDNVKFASYAGALVPYGFAAVKEPLNTTTNYPSASLVTEQVVDGEYNKKVYYGFDFNKIDNSIDNDNWNYLAPLPANAAVGNNADFDLGSYLAHPSSSTPNISLSSSAVTADARKFIVPFQDGFDGFDPARLVKRGKDITSTNTFGYDVSTNGADGSLAYNKALDALENQDLYDFNMLLLPGIIRESHSSVSQKAIDLCETRGDAFYVMDPSNLESSITSVIATVDPIDTSYAAAYYPWVKILDTALNKPVWVPPSVVLGGVIAYNDRVAYEWFAPAGLNRGGLTEVIDAYDRVSQSDRDDLYEGRVNPIASFPNQGFVVWGQKTLQVKSSALDRINVRRLLIAAKKFVASSTKYLVFEQNTGVTRNRFLNIVNPYFESIQQRQGLYAFKVVMDETNNTPDVIDRNQMVGAIYLQPAKTAEFILLDFNILPTGAAFPTD